jgi:hypothetical protein
MARMAGKQCRIDADISVKREILDRSGEDRREIGEFLERLQVNPLPAGIQQTEKGAYSFRLPCGIFVVWEIVGDLLHLALHGPDESILVRILGAG